MGEHLYREVVGLDEDALLPDSCEHCGRAVEGATRHLLVVVHEWAEGGDDGAWCLCPGCVTLILSDVYGRL